MEARAWWPVGRLERKAETGGWVSVGESSLLETADDFFTGVLTARKVRGKGMWKLELVEDMSLKCVCGR